MRLLRVQVPEFRALKDVDISFEPEFTPQVFPLGSENGGGKSTLLQLIFVLLHCSINKQRTIIINYLLEKFAILDDENYKNLATFWILDDKSIKLEFSVYSESFLKDNNFIDSEFSSDFFKKRKKIWEEINNINAEINKLQDSNQNTSSLIPSLGYNPIEKAKNDLEEKKEIVINELNLIESQINNFTTEIEYKGYIYITNLEFSKENKFLLVNSEDLTPHDLLIFLENLSHRVFLASPSTQPYLFFPKNLQELMFKREPLSYSYETLLNESKKDFLPNFFNYDSAKYGLIESLNNAMYKDFYSIRETGKYGNNYQNLLDTINNVLGFGKKIEPQMRDSMNKDKDMIYDILFKIESNKYIYTEDLSHGELKRLSIYVWIKTILEGENIVLMDEIENAFHPDWQYEIVRDLLEWGKNNQYILATHSYELCTAVTPAHVKELEPKLIKN
jgi:DNA repair exonuclease SbcCD ATPase subunit